MSKNNNKERIIDNSEDLKDKITESMDAFKLRADLLVANLKEGGNDGCDHSTSSAGEKGLKSGKVSGVYRYRTAKRRRRCSSQRDSKNSRGQSKRRDKGRHFARFALRLFR